MDRSSPAIALVISGTVALGVHACGTGVEAAVPVGRRSVSHLHAPSSAHGSGPKGHAAQGPATQTRAQRAAESAAVLHVATLNLAHGRGLAVDQFGLSQQQFQANIDAAAAVAKREFPDVFAVQEADAPSASSGQFDHVARLAKLAGFPNVHHGLHLDAGFLGIHVRCGTALLAKRPLLSPASHPFLANAKYLKGFVTAEIEFDRRTVVVASIHLASGSKSIRQHQAEQIINSLQSQRSAMVLMGDLNSTWTDEEDAVRMIASRLRLKAYEPQSHELPTFRANRPRVRIDWILSSPDLEFVDYRVWPDQVSDHLGVWANLRWKR